MELISKWFLSVAQSYDAIKISSAVDEVGEGPSVNMERCHTLLKRGVEVTPPRVDDAKIYTRIGDAHRGVGGAVGAGVHLDGFAGVFFGPVVVTKPRVAGGGVEDPLGVVEDEVVVGVLRHRQTPEHLGSAGEGAVGFATVADAGQASGFLEGELDHGAGLAGDCLAHAGGGDDVFVAAFDEGEPC
ncbi:hypothetical protein AB0C33_06675 [Nonomuraea sp. NPDC048881]|uniref:hypothetical protein n=1 Tax=Nonomuraea sp. NPDC048881 TaxID=3155030 RepID=UPI003400E8A0